MTRILRRYGGSKAAKRRRVKATSLEFWAITDTHFPVDGSEDPHDPENSQGDKLFWAAPGKMRDFVAQANTEQPHAAIHAGDIIEITNGFEKFNTIWAGLTMQSEVVPGNHDYSIPYDTTRMQAMADALGFGEAPMVAGSRLNRSFTATGNGITARFIAIDVNIKRDWTPPTAAGGLTEDQKTWIAGELASSPEDNIFIMTHHGPHDYQHGWFVAQDAEDLRLMVVAAKAARPARNIIGLFGHNHSVRFGPRPYDNMAGFPAVCIPTNVELLRAPYAKFYLTPDGSLLTDTGWVTHTP